MYTPVEHKGVCSEYVVCNCPTNYIKLAVPICVSPSGTLVACMRCHAALEDCSLAPLSEVREAGLPHGRSNAA